MKSRTRATRHGARILALLMVAVAASGAWGGSAALEYDSLGRLKSITYSNGVSIVYIYDAAGNRTSYAVTGAPS